MITLFLTVLPGCSRQSTVATVTTAGGEPAYAPAIVDNLLQALNKDDYTAYTKDFDSAMKSAMPETVFEQTRAMIQDRIGEYVSRKYTDTQTQDGYTVVFYKAKFSKEPADVTMKFVFQESGGNALISGLWFDSPKLRGQ
jgi:Protein of unknown function (DUF3887)